MMRIVLIFVVLIVLGGGAAGYFLVILPSQEAQQAQAEEPPPEPHFIEFNPIQVPIVSTDRVEQFVNIVVGLQVKDQPTGDKVLARALPLNDAILLKLYGHLHSDEALLPNGAVNLRVIKAAIMDAGDEVFGEGVIQDVLIQVVSQRKLNTR